eukprot:1035953-Prorocentrum_lima.AAC.1
MCHYSLTTALQRAMEDAQVHMRDVMEHTVQSAMDKIPSMLASKIASVVPPAPPGPIAGPRVPHETPLPALPQ